MQIRENITPIGDGNSINDILTSILCQQIRENITPIGDGNFLTARSFNSFTFNYKREYNSDRRRKLLIIVIFHQIDNTQIRENITPIGDGNSYIKSINTRIC